ncbi:MAG TPA: hypothetical protein VHF05_02845 [Candidatus Paceibacterota bacterium]|nr:hypothetical protein [Candidatus Paceibacterota bacterium]
MDTLEMSTKWIEAGFEFLFAEATQSHRTFRKFREEVYEKFDQVKHRLDAVEKRLDAVEKRLSSLEEKVDEILQILKSKN